MSLPPSSPKTLIEASQYHERVWGIEEYPERPSLTQLLQARVVVFWQHAEDGERWRATVHADLTELEQAFAKLLTRQMIGQKPRRIVAMYEDGQEVRLKSVKVEFERVLPPAGSLSGQ
ncbi:MAG: hypothetical protein ACOYLB_11615 [Phototrophicaceae bacterium]